MNKEQIEELKLAVKILDLEGIRTRDPKLFRAANTIRQIAEDEEDKLRRKE